MNSATNTELSMNNHNSPEFIDSQIAAALHYTYLAPHYDVLGALTAAQRNTNVRNLLAAAFHADRDPAFAAYAPLLRRVAAAYRGVTA
jgi:hypothetical protein